MKEYIVYYDVKAYRKEWRESMTVNAENQKQAKWLVANCMETVYKHHAFHINFNNSFRLGHSIPVERERIFKPWDGFEKDFAEFVKRS